MDRPAPILDVSHLTIRFGDREVLRDLSFTVAAGSALAVIGPNGSGKTVLFKALIGALPCEGSIRWAPGVRIGYVPQKLDIERDVPLTGLDFLLARAALGRLPRESVGRTMELVGLARDVVARPIGAMSGGQFQRLLVAFALVGRPNVLLLDEPTAGVDEPGEERLNELVHRLQHEEALTVLLISHELSVVYRYAENVLCLSYGYTCVGPPREVLTPDVLRQLYGGSDTVHVHEH